MVSRGRSTNAPRPCLLRFLSLLAALLTAGVPASQAASTPNLNYLSPLTTRPDLAKPYPAHPRRAARQLLAAEASAVAFLHGVASGDPGVDYTTYPYAATAILWTKGTPASDLPGSIVVNFAVASDEGMNDVVMSGSTLTSSAVDFTVKVTVGGLQLGGQFYYYQFSDEAGNVKSPVGRLKTLQQGDVSHVRFAVVSCSNVPAGYFNVYQSVASQDVDLVLHLGDYIYEYKSGEFGTGFAAVDPSRAPQPDRDLVTLSDYRTRHAQYKTDEGAQAAHAKHTWVAVWDDHDFADNAWAGGAANHNPATEGSWAARKSAAMQAYFEYMPVGQVDPTDPARIFRSFNFGSLVHLTMLDARVYGRQIQVDDPTFPGVNNTAAQLAVATSPGRTILGDYQEQYLYAQLDQSRAVTWKVIGQQVVLGQFLTRGRPELGITPVINFDAWDGYADNRDRILAKLQAENMDNVVFLSGDTHSSIANDLPRFAYPGGYCATRDAAACAYDPATGAGSLAVEFLTTAVSSPSSIETFYGPGGPGTAAEQVAQVLTPVFQQDNPHQRYLEWNSKGYVILDLTPERAQGTYCYVSTVFSKSFTTSCAASLTTKSGANHLELQVNGVPVPVQSPGAPPPASAPAPVLGPTPPASEVPGTAPAPGPSEETSTPTPTATGASPGPAPGSTQSDQTPTPTPTATGATAGPPPGNGESGQSPTPTPRATGGPGPAPAPAPGALCDPQSEKPNQCFNAAGSASVCCRGSCPSEPAAEPFCT